MKRRITIDVRLVRRGRRAAVVALEGGSPFDLRLALEYARAYDRAPLLLAVDGGIAACRAIRRRPDLFVGDLDSARTPPPRVRAVIYPAEKDFSDFSGALSEARAMGVDIVVVAGVLGGRLDHEWGNLLEVGAAAPGFAGILAPSSRGLVVVTARGARVRKLRGRTVSVFALGGAAKVSLRGTRWTLRRRELAPGSLGLSNVGVGVVELAVHRGVAALVFPEPRG
ncbi:MAG TPA: thiamine diphosphokinase [Candidatus Polarisedimenticolaceae bacterium]|nr:thiamine diphosphokinase [Candidatus Polarisedimenticolaceae bacterium]